MQPTDPGPMGGRSLRGVGCLTTLVVSLGCAGCYGGEFAPVLFGINHGHLMRGESRVVQAGNMGSDVAELITFGGVSVIDLDGAPSDYVIASPTADGELTLDARTVGVGYVRLELEVDPPVTWFLVDVREGSPGPLDDGITYACRRTYGNE